MYTTLLSKCSNHLGLLLPSNTKSDHQRDKVLLALVCVSTLSNAGDIFALKVMLLHNAHVAGTVVIKCNSL